MFFEAISIIEEIMSDPKFRLQAEEIFLRPASGRVLEVYLNEHLIFSKKSLNRFPRKNEILFLIEEYYRENRVTIKD